MEQFIVSARKYRPNTFESLIGQENIATTLKNSIIRGQLAHAYLFCGPRGVGKTTTARIFAKSINCLNPSPDMEPCGKCESCLSFTEGRSYCIHELDAASNNSVDDIRNLTDMVRIPPQIGKYSVYIIDEVHMLSASAFNAFLKTLEEPPAHAIFILATTEKHKILPTILSRCQTYDFNRITIADMVKNLKDIAEKEGVSIDDDALHIIAQKADGAMRDALTLFDQTVAFCGKEIKYEQVIQNLNVLDYEYYFRLVECFLKSDYTSALMIFDEILSKGFNALHFISGLSSHFRDLLVCREGASESLLQLPPSLVKRYKEQSALCPVPFIFNALSITTACEAGYRQSGNQRLLIEFALMKLSVLLNSPAAMDVPVAKPSPAQVKTVPEPAPAISAAPAAAIAPAAPEKATPAVQPAPVAPAAPAPETPTEKTVVPATAAPAEAPQKPTHQPPVKNLSLKEMLRHAESMSSSASESNNDKAAEAFDIDKFSAAWKEIMAAEAAKKRTMLANALLLYPPEIQPDGTTVVIYVSNFSQKDWIEKNNLNRLIAVTRERLNNYGIILRLEVHPTEGGTAKGPFTPLEKGEYLLKNNEELENLKKDLDLDIK